MADIPDAAAEAAVSPEPLGPQEMLEEFMDLFGEASPLILQRTELQAELDRVDGLIASDVKAMAAKSFAQEPAKRPAMNKWVPGPGGHAMMRTNLLAAKEVIGLEVGALWQKRLEIVRAFAEAGVRVNFSVIDETTEDTIYVPSSHEPLQSVTGRITVSTPFRFDMVDVERGDGSIARVHLFDKATEEQQVIATAGTL